MNQKSLSVSKGWTVVIAGLSINLILGVLYAWGVIQKSLVKSEGWTQAHAALPFSVATACFALMMVFAGRWQDRFGPRRVAAAGGALLGLGLLASALADSWQIMTLTFGLGAGLGIGLGYSATTPPAIKWFPPARKGFITGIVVSGVGLAAVYISPLAQHLLKSVGRSNTFTTLGVAVLLIVPLLAQLLRNPPPPASTAAATPGPAAARRPDSDWQDMLRTPQFYQLWFLMVLSASAGLMIITQVALIAKDQANWDWGFVPIATLAIFNTLGRLLSGVLSDRIGRTRTMAFAFALQAVNMVAFRHYNTACLVVFGSAFTGLCYGGVFTLMPAATADFFGIRNLGVNYGLIFTAFGFAGVLGPMLGAKIHDQYHSYALAFLISAGMLIVGALLALFTSSPASPGSTQPGLSPVGAPLPRTT